MDIQVKKNEINVSQTKQSINVSTHKISLGLKIYKNEISVGIKKNEVKVSMQGTQRVIYVVNNITDRDNIPNKARYDGFFVYVKSEHKNYQLQGGIENTYWKDFISGAITTRGEVVGVPVAYLQRDIAHSLGRIPSIICYGLDNEAVRPDQIHHISNSHIQIIRLVAQAGTIVLT